MALEDLKRNRMMANLLDALERHEDVGHYGRLVFTMVARHFLEPEEVVAWLAKDRDFDEARALGLLDQVVSRGYSPPRRERILQWQAQQSFRLTPDADDPDEANVYRDLHFPDGVYAHIGEYHEHRAEAALDRGAPLPR